MFVRFAGVVVGLPAGVSSLSRGRRRFRGNAALLISIVDSHLQRFQNQRANFCLQTCFDHERAVFVVRPRQLPRCLLTKPSDSIGLNARADLHLS